MKAGFREELPKKMTALLSDAVTKGAFPSASAGLFSQGKEYYSAAGYIGEKLASEDSFYDLASLTKPFASALLAMKLYEDGRLDIEAEILPFFKELKGSLLSGIRVSNLLDHTSGLRPWLPLYKLGQGAGKTAVLRMIGEEGRDISPCEKTIYSDLNYILLWYIFEKLLQKDPAIEIRRLYKEIGVLDLDFPLPDSESDVAIKARDNPFSLKREFQAIAPSEFRGDYAEPLRGKVSDCNARLLGGYNGHAGLFGSARGAIGLARALLEAHCGRKTKGAPLPETVRLFWGHRREKCGHFALGWDRPSKIGSLAGDLISKNSVGHLGFSGCSIWIDIEQEIIIALLSNRVYPHRLNDRIKRFRPFFNDEIMKELL